MIKVEHIEVFNFEGAIRGLRNPMNSWDKSDTEYEYAYGVCHTVKIGKNDLSLMRRLCKAGEPHRKFMRQIFICMDITAPLFWWKEFDTYKVGTTSNSCSTMHKIHDKEFTLDDFSHEHLDSSAIKALEYTIAELNCNRELFLYDKNKDHWWQMIQLLSSSYNQKRTITMNYENAINMIEYRTGHKLDEWNEFVDILWELPYMKEIAGGERMKPIALSDTDIKVLRIFLDNCNPCRCSCAYPEMQGKYPEGCSECQFTKDMIELKKKISR